MKDDGCMSRKVVKEKEKVESRGKNCYKIKSRRCRCMVGVQWQERKGQVKQ